MKITDLTDRDKGRRVIYTPSAGRPEVGTISSWNDDYVFVRYTAGSTAAATHPTDLTFENE